MPWVILSEDILKYALPTAITHQVKRGCFLPPNGMSECDLPSPKEGVDPDLLVFIVSLVFITR